MDTHKFHYTTAQCLYLLHNAPTCFGHLQGATSLIDIYGNLSQMTANICDKLPYMLYVGETCSSLKVAKMYSRNMQEHCIKNTNIVQLVGCVCIRLLHERCTSNIKMNFKQITVGRHGTEPIGCIQCKEFLDQLQDYSISFSRMALLHGFGSPSQDEQDTYL